MFGVRLMRSRDSRSRAGAWGQSSLPKERPHDSPFRLERAEAATDWQAWGRLDECLGGVGIGSSE